MISTARLRQGAEAPVQGAILMLLITATCWLIGLLEAFGVQRPLILPLTIVVGLLLGRWALRWMYIALVLLMLVAAIGIWSPVVPRLATPFVRTDTLNLSSVDAVFVFSGAVTTRGLVSGEALDRLLTGIALRARRPELPLILSVVRSSDRPQGLTSMQDQKALVALVPASGGLEWIDSVYSTRDEAVRLSRRAFQARWKRVAVITSPMHTRRACATVEALGLPVTCVAAPWRVAGLPPRTPGDRLLLMKRLVYESLAWAQYRITGWASWS
jgi:uncharacterized SAM-binding protein YcdF (DUF218 family)